MNIITFLFFIISFKVSLTLFSKSPLYLLPASIAGKSKLYTILFSKNSGTLDSTILRASPSTIAVFPTPASPIRIGLFFVLLNKICKILSISLSLPITWSIFPLFALSLRLTVYFSKVSVVISVETFEVFSKFIFSLISKEILSGLILESINILYARDDFNSIKEIKRWQGKTWTLSDSIAIFTALSTTFFAFFDNLLATLEKLPTPLFSNM